MEKDLFPAVKNTMVTTKSVNYMPKILNTPL